MFAQPGVLEDGTAPSGKSILHFFPIDNKKGQSDPVLQQLMKTLHSEVLKDNYVKQPVSLVWMALLDWLQGLEGPTVSLVKVEERCRALGMAEQMQDALKVFHNLGVIMYHCKLVTWLSSSPTTSSWTPPAVSRATGVLTKQTTSKGRCDISMTHLHSTFSHH